MDACKYASPLGEIILAAENGILMGLWFAKQKYECAGFDIEPEKLAFSCTCQVIRDTKRWLDIYFSGKKPEFDIEISPRGTEFQRRVWEELTKIEYGRTSSYGELALKLGCRSARAVGAAVGRNPISIIVPCHRVLGANGSLTGYAGGIERKYRLLKLEGAIE